MDTSTSFIFYLLFAFLGILLSVIIVRWLFKINEMAAYQKSTMYLLKNIAEKSGVSKEIIQESLKPFTDLKKGKV